MSIDRRTKLLHLSNARAAVGNQSLPQSTRDKYQKAADSLDLSLGLENALQAKAENQALSTMQSPQPGLGQPTSPRVWGAGAAPEPGTAGEQGVAAGAEPAGVAPLLPTAAHPDLPQHTEGNGGLESLDPTQIGVDADRFQFKAGGDEAGVTERLEGVQKWDPRLAGTVLVFRAADRKDWIADGHQRLALAKRLIAAGQEGVRLNAFVLDAKDGHTDADVRAIAAAKNIAEGTGTSVDAAKVIKHAASGIKLPPLPPRSARWCGKVGRWPGYRRMRSGWW